MKQIPVVLQKKRFDGAMYNAAGSSYQMQWNIAEGYNIAYQEDDLGSIAVAESMNQVCACTPSVDRTSVHLACFHMLHDSWWVQCPTRNTQSYSLPVFAFHTLQTSAHHCQNTVLGVLPM